MHPHDRWLELAALDEIGELTAEEHEALRDHLRECADCRAGAAAMSGVTREWLPLASAARPARAGAQDERDARDAFLSRARAEGLRFSEAAAVGRRPWLVWAAPWNTAPVGAAAALVVLLIASLVSRVPAPAASPEAPVPLAAAALPGTPVAVAPAARPSTDTDRLRLELEAMRREVEATRAQLAAVQREVAVERQRAASLERLLVDTEERLGRSRAEVLQARLEADEADSRLTAGRRDLDLLRAQLDQVSAARAADREALEARLHDLQDLARQVQAQTQRADRAHELLAADRDIRDLMSARNLHIVDVRDTDARGKTRRAFGRVFYTEGKSLIFYAYDLEPSRLQNAAFQVWGAKTGSENRAVSLGMLFSDDQNQARWMMKFDNPKVLREIDSVFVTVERPGGSKKPSNQRMLYAYLLNEPNHR